MERRCPVCHEGTLQEIVQSSGKTLIQCSAYPACRFTADNWDTVPQTVARFHHPIQPGHN